MAFMKTGWATTRTSETQLEVWPDYDIIEHKHSFACPCNPTVDSAVHDGIVYWTTIHNSFDEYLDESETEPYKGL